ncbi:MAG: zinc carboxypeptidase [Flavobacteriia bacterium]|nr:zinc carboxypeptidase [Flavobacteriia bacterium]OIP47128.1 MAG: zinc carboxypeptidase [Flavobacteriaceae bacterium CG2_30_31_66]PIV96438.1 MAG: zinc carboxypeptidase [Flavobacteriaceae bacterium CG17_big_fil_post_rev_8_21_14_2_50_31_13]PIX13483.1 MAG: zinc carboxypeptidase [Flavobacteriaceae bacterium CG_4_8_14_3_um_filter_31_8]PIY16396.1 MAG: zinc carboxypeptidase [Flavobacteriaceae bacterium CG_4_10_14_3_um_filter_31_253]PIZ11401.1 MAG: zinc carboxypeptidase [Flavobacteriaceae bacterium C
MKIHKIILVAIVTISNLNAQNIQSPSEFLGYEIGSRFTRHHKVVDYFEYVSKSLPNVKLEKYGETNEHRPLYILFISSEENIKNLEEIRKANLSQTGILKGNLDNKIAIVWLSYNVHGNEASSTEASMLTLYELVTLKKEWLKNTLVIIDPCINPDGRDRYVNWHQQVKSSPFDISQDAKEHHEPWPGGRPNHYLFDLNRDWAWATQIETQQRLKVYNKWMPHIHVDFHEQSINNPYYFAPAAAPFHEIITEWQRNFQIKIGKNHASYFDKEGWLYFTKESFDLLYPSYGDTYPTYVGAIGMTYEQAGLGRAGLGIETDKGEILTLKDRALHHKTTGLSTVEMASKNAEKINSEFKKFFFNSNLEFKSYVLKNDNIDKTNRLKKLLDKHEISYEYAINETVKGILYSTHEEGKMNTSVGDLVIHTNQPKGKMVKVLFEPKAFLADSLTYDITAWSIPYAHGFESIASKTIVNSSKSIVVETVKNSVDKNAYAYISKWNSLEDAVFLGALLQKNITPRFSQKPFSIDGKSYERGTLIILRNDNKNTDFDEKLIEIANKNQRSLYAVSTGFVTSGADFGSESVKPIQKQKVALLSGNETSSLSFGEIWHFFESDLQYPITILNSDYFGNVNLSNFDVIIIPDGGYDAVLSKNMLDKLTTWVQSGGTIIAIDNALQSFADAEGFALKTKEAEKETDVKNLTSYADLERKNVKNMITGAIFKSKVDNTHPLAFGYKDIYFSLKLSNKSYQYLEKGMNVAYFDANSKNISGYAGSLAVKNISESLLFGEEQKGRGSIVYMVDNPLFRSFWENGKLFLANAVFLLNSDVIKK